MKRIIPLFLAVLLLAGCGGTPAAQPTQTVPVSTTSETYAPLISPDAGEIPFSSLFSSETTITLSADVTPAK